MADAMRGSGKAPETIPRPLPSTGFMKDQSREEESKMRDAPDLITTSLQSNLEVVRIGPAPQMYPRDKMPHPRDKVPAFAEDGWHPRNKVPASAEVTPLVPQFVQAATGFMAAKRENARKGMHSSHSRDFGFSSRLQFDHQGEDGPGIKTGAPRSLLLLGSGDGDAMRAAGHGEQLGGSHHPLVIPKPSKLRFVVLIMALSALLAVGVLAVLKFGTTLLDRQLRASPCKSDKDTSAAMKGPSPSDEGAIGICGCGRWPDEDRVPGESKVHIKVHMDGVSRGQLLDLCPEVRTSMGEAVGLQGVRVVLIVLSGGETDVDMLVAFSLAEEHKEREGHLLDGLMESISTGALDAVLWRDWGMLVSSSVVEQSAPEAHAESTSPAGGSEAAGGATGTSEAVIKLALSLPLAAKDFTGTERNSVVRVLAAAAGVSESKVKIQSVAATPTRRRRLMAAALRIDLTIAVAAGDGSAATVADRLSVERINSGLQDAGLPAATLVEPPTVLDSDTWQCPQHATAPAGAASSDSCTCDSGYYGSSAACLPCEPGFFCPVTSNLRFQCPPNTRSPAKAVVPEECICDGGYYGVPGGPCSPCEFGHFCPGMGQRVACPAFRYVTSYICPCTSIIASTPPPRTTPPSLTSLPLIYKQV